ncbi:MAG TPA: DUF3300 domain-containing protein [Rhodopila sp.]|nr:DUF3300 domain-containing protein [Rhodopila sp.]
MSRRLVRLLACGLILHATFPLDALAQTQAAPAAQPADNQPFSADQLDALVASIALYPDELLTQVLMASTSPLEVVEATRWVQDPTNKSLSGDALEKALEKQPWDPSVKSLVPFPAVLAVMNNNLTWLQQLGYAFSTQQADVLASVQRLRRQAKANGKLESSDQQVVSTDQVTVEPPAGSSQPPAKQDVIVIASAQPDTVYVPTYNPSVVYGTWPSPSYPPYYAAPPPGYYFGTALVTGMAFAAGAAVVGGLWGWARPSWGGGYANVNVNRYNNINVNRGQINSSRWNARTTAAGRPASFSRPPGGPVGLPGRSQVSVPGSAVRPPTRAGGAGGVGRPGGVGGAGGAGRPGGVGGVSGAGTQRQAGAFRDMNSGRQAGQFGQRGAQSRSFSQQRPAGGGRGGVSGGGRGGGGGGGGGGRRR